MSPGPKGVAHYPRSWRTLCSNQLSLRNLCFQRIGDSAEPGPKRLRATAPHCRTHWAHPALGNHASLDGRRHGEQQLGDFLSVTLCIGYCIALCPLVFPLLFCALSCPFVLLLTLVPSSPRLRVCLSTCPLVLLSSCLLVCLSLSLSLSVFSSLFVAAAAAGC